MHPPARTSPPLAEDPALARSPALPRKTEEALDRLREVEADEEADCREVVSAGLRHGSSTVVARAARLAGERRLHALEGEVQGAMVRLLDRDRHADPGCSAKLALAEALDLLEGLDPEPFERGVRLRQLEPAWGGPEDSAKGLRARCGYALARLHGFEALPLLADLLADEAPGVRREAARAVAHAGGSGAVALLKHKVHVGDADAAEAPDIVGEALASLGLLEPAAALDVARVRLERSAAGISPTFDRASSVDVAVALTLGELRLPEAVPLLSAWCAALRDPRDEEAAVTAIAVSRCPAALEWLLGQCAEAEPGLAELAARALGLYRYQEGTERAARRAASRNRHLDLESVLDEVFAD